MDMEYTHTKMAIYMNYYNSGNRYEGEFKNDHGEGYGIFYYSNGERHEGQFHNGKPIGKHKKYLNDGNIEEIEY